MKRESEEEVNVGREDPDEEEEWEYYIKKIEE